MKELFKYLYRHLPLIILSLIFSIGCVAGQLYIPFLSGDAIDCIVETGNVDFAGIMHIILIAAITIAAVGAVNWLMNVVNNKITYAIVRDIRKEAFEKIHKIPIKTIDASKTGDIVSRVINDVDQLADGLLLGFTQFFTGILTILGTLVFMLLINFKIALVVVCATPLSFFVASFIARKTHNMFMRQSILKAKQTSFINEMINGEKVVMAYGYEEDAQKEFDEINNELATVQLKATFFSSLTNPSTRFINGLIYAVVCLVGAFSAIDGGITVGNLSVLLSYANQYTKPFNEITNVYTELQNAFACAKRVLEFLNNEEMPDESGLSTLELKEGEGAVKAENVAFSYDKEKELIRNFNLDVKPGETIAIVGPTGCGKTTFINLLMGFYDIDEGKISIEGTDVKNITKQSLRKNYGMVLQDTYLKSGTIRDNIRFGKPEATDEEIVQAAKTAHSHSFIKKLPNGYDTVIGENGGDLSEGQKQLLCITRVMLCLPRMLILDEATSSIDTRTEVRIQKAFSKMMKNRTSFVVAHRLSTIQNADLILVMKDGKIIEQGTHEKLLSQGGFYHELYYSQFEHGCAEVDK